MDLTKQNEYIVKLLKDRGVQAVIMANLPEEEKAEAETHHGVHGREEIRQALINQHFESLEKRAQDLEDCVGDLYVKLKELEEKLEKKMTNEELVQLIMLVAGVICGTVLVMSLLG